MAKSTQIADPAGIPMTAAEATAVANHLSPDLRERIAFAGLTDAAGIMHAEPDVIGPLTASLDSVRASGIVLAAARARARTHVVAYANDITARITAAYPDAEVASWPTREAEARAVAAGQTLPEGAMLTALAAASGQTQADYAARILAKAAAYRQVVVAVTVIREAAQAAIAAATTHAKIDEALAAIKAQAETKAAELGLAS